MLTLNATNQKLRFLSSFISCFLPIGTNKKHTKLNNYNHMERKNNHIGKSNTIKWITARTTTKEI